MREWTTTEVAVLRAFATLGVDAIGTILERSAGSVARKAQELRISTRVTGEDLDLTLTPARLIAWIKQTPGFQICPTCSKRLAMMKTTGMCRPCHLDRLIDLRLEQLDVQAREKRLTKLRQDKKRQRICTQCARPFYPRLSSPDTRCGSCSGNA
jgi:hypothetical protein